MEEKGLTLETRKFFRNFKKDEVIIDDFEFDMWKKTALEMGIQAVLSGPYVRSSYYAGEVFNDVNSFKKKMYQDQ